MKTLKNNKKLAKSAIIWKAWKRGCPLEYYIPNGHYFYKGYTVCIYPYEIKEYFEKGIRFKEALQMEIDYQKSIGIKPVPIFWAVVLQPVLLFFALIIRKYEYLRYYLWNKIKRRIQSFYRRKKGEFYCFLDKVIWRDIEIEYPAIKYKDDTAWGSDVILILDTPKYRKSNGTWADPPEKVNTFLNFSSKKKKETKVRLRGKKNIITGEVRLIECLSHSGCWFDFYLASTSQMIFLK
jgi:hypothetical protein